VDIPAASRPCGVAWDWCKRRPVAALQNGATFFPALSATRDFRVRSRTSRRGTGQPNLKPCASKLCNTLRLSRKSALQRDPETICYLGHAAAAGELVDGALGFDGTDAVVGEIVHHLAQL